MKLKLDENLGSRGAELLRLAGHDVATVVEQRLAGTNDGALIKICHRERRCLVTLDVEFGNPLLFPPAKYAGIVVLRLSPKSAPEDLSAEIRTLIGGLAQVTDIAGKLWIIQRGRVREYRPESDAGSPE